VVRTEDSLSSALRRGEISPEEGLDLLQRDEVAVWRPVHLSDAPTWSEREDAVMARPTVLHVLLSMGADKVLIDSYAREIERIQRMGPYIEDMP
jgi:hypothetical protein